MIKIILDMSIYGGLFTTLLIIFLLLDKLGFWGYTIEVVYTHPHFDKYVLIVGAIVEATSIGIVGSVGYTYFTIGDFSLKALLYGIIGITTGTTIKEFFRKAK